MPHVPFFQEKLQMSMDKYFLKLKENNPVQRLNWTCICNFQLNYLF